MLPYITQADEIPFANGVLVESLELCSFSIVRDAHAAVFSGNHQSSLLEKLDAM